jgi:hypothetical protein
MMGRTLGVLVAISFLLTGGGAAQAQDGVLDEIDKFLKGVTDELDNNLLFGKFRFTPRISQSFIYDDNIWQNDEHEGAYLYDENFGYIRETRGREWDFISDSKIDLSLVLPVNPNFTKFFRRDHMVLLGYEVHFLEYMRRGETDAINQTIYTDLFGFFQDLFQWSVGNEQGFFFDAGAMYRDITNPLDIYERSLGAALVGIPDLPPILRQDSEIRWNEISAHATFGYRTNVWDVRAGYRFDYIDFSKDFYSQADQSGHTGMLEVGCAPPALGGARVFVRGEYTDLDFDEGLLNDAEIYDVRVGFDGSIPSLFSRKLRFYLEAGVRIWDSEQTGSFEFRNSSGEVINRENPDTDDFAGFVWLARIVYQPWQEQQTRFQFETSRNVVWSAISNFRSDYRVELSAFHELLPRKLDVDATVSWSRYDPSDGPHRYMIEAGAGVRYHLLEQVTLFARYLFRNQRGRKELEITFIDPDAPGGPQQVDLRSDSDFHQNIFQVGIEITF